MIIDAHIHLFPDPIAQRAIPHLASICKSPAFTDGTLAQTEQKLREWGVDIGVAMHIATKPSQQKSVNTWAASIQGGRLLCFGSVHPDAEDWPEALQYIKNAGLRGIKMHPDYQDFFIDDKRLFPIYDAIAALELPVTFHAGWDPLSPDCVHASPAAIKRVAKLFPKLKIIAAHMGGMRLYDEVEETLAGSDLFFDTSMSARLCPPEQFVRLVHKHGADHVLFASDCPWSRSCDELQYIEASSLSSAEKEKIYFRNACELFHLPI